jgi:SPP1 gp7 family putative phage head morphogenesis protein
VIQQSKEKNKQMSESFIAYLLLMLKYNNDPEFKKLLVMYKQHRDELKDYISKVYLKYIKNNELNMTYRDINKEVNKIQNKLEVIGNDLRKQEDILLSGILYAIYNSTYNKSIDILSKYKLGNMLNSTATNKTLINKVLNSEIDGKNNAMRNKLNKEKFLNKVKKDIKKAFISKKSIEMFNETIDKGFQSGVNASDILIDNEIARVYGRSVMQGYSDIGIEKVEWVSELEINTCSECAALDGQIFAIDTTPIPIGDTHVNCKCILVPVI